MTESVEDRRLHEPETRRSGDCRPMANPLPCTDHTLVSLICLYRDMTWSCSSLSLGEQPSPLRVKMASSNSQIVSLACVQSSRCDPSSAIQSASSQTCLEHRKSAECQDALVAALNASQSIEELVCVFCCCGRSKSIRSAANLCRSDCFMQTRPAFVSLTQCTAPSQSKQTCS